MRVFLIKMVYSTKYSITLADSHSLKKVLFQIPDKTIGIEDTVNAIQLLIALFISCLLFLVS